MANYSRWEDIKKTKGKPSDETRTAINQILEKRMCPVGGFTDSVPIQVKPPVVAPEIPPSVDRECIAAQRARAEHRDLLDIVEKGGVVAQMGSTGRSTGPHVHFEVLRNGKAMNPERYINRASL